MVIFGLMIPFIGTTLGAAMVFLMKNEINCKIEKLLLGFASGVMIAASVWSLIIPSIEMAEGYKLKFLPAASGFIVGVAFLTALDCVVLRLHINESSEASRLRKTAMMALAVTLHNIPEGMAVGVALAAAMNGNSKITLASATALSIGIAVQNFPEGSIISMPLKGAGIKKGKAFLLGTLSGAVEPIFGFLTVLITSAVVAALPYLLSFAAGAMIYVVAEELIPESHEGKRTRLATSGLALGFVLMMALDVYFS